ncbi:MAG: hypothetical protein R3C44_18915 [Chloroflexota bacterium]
MNSIALGYSLAEMGRFDESFDLLIQAIDYAARAQFYLPQAIIPVILTWIYGLLGNINYHHEQMRAWMESVAESDSTAFFRQAWDAIHLLNKGKTAKAAEVVKDIYEYENLGDGPEGLFVALVLPAALLADNRNEEALAVIDTMLTKMDKAGYNALRAHYLRYRAVAQRGLGDESGALATLKSAYQIALQQQAHASAWLVLIDLTALEPDESTRKAYRARAIEEIDYLAANLSDPELLESFTSLPAVRNLKSGTSS